VPIPRELGLLLHAYLEGQRPRLFLFETRTGKAWDRRAIERVVRGWGRLAEVEGKCNRHRFRHTYATTLLERGAKPAQIQKPLAHTDISTTMLYTEVSSEELAEVARSCWTGPVHTGKSYAHPGEGGSLSARHH